MEVNWVRGPVWRDGDLTGGCGEFVAILVPNGSGKWTLLKTLLGVLPLTDGTISVFGKPVRRGNDEIGYLPQRRRFDADLRIRAADLVRLGLDGARWGLPVPAWLAAGARSKEARVSAVIGLVGAQAYAARPIGELWGGEQHRILIDQALVSGARKKLLDEPVDSRDLNKQQSMETLRQTSCREQEVTRRSGAQ